jgi:quinoprotein glucose dehydrogenase
LLAVDAERGKPAAGFGDEGSVDLKASIRGDVDGGFSLTSPPSIYKNVVITGGNNGEASPSYGLYGDIRGWDARSGKLLWSFHTVPRPGEPGVETWENESWKNRPARTSGRSSPSTRARHFYAPIGAPTSDYYGGDRKGANLYGNSVVALDAATGRLKWHRQVVHHDLWDYDVPAAPILVDVKRNGRTIPAVAVMTKMALVFILDRVTGEPIFGVEERPVPQSTVPGEASWPTQPFPLKPAPLARNTFDPAKDFYIRTADHAAYCKSCGIPTRCTPGPVYAAGVDGTMVTSQHARRRQLERVLVRSDARPRVHQREEPRAGRQEGAGHGTRRRTDDVGASQPVGRLRRTILESGDEDPVFGPAVRRAGRARRQPR